LAPNDVLITSTPSSAAQVIPLAMSLLDPVKSLRSDRTGTIVTWGATPTMPTPLSPAPMMPATCVP
jgi:hypothetical protein